jgi:hypothetical protein
MLIADVIGEQSWRKQETDRVLYFDVLSRLHVQKAIYIGKSQEVYTEWCGH